MKHFEKLQDLIRMPQKYGVKKGTRVFKMLCEIYMHGEAQTGNSDKRFKYVHTSEVIDALQRAGVKCEYFNNAPRRGARGEHVALCGKLKKDVVHNYAKYVKEHSDLMWYECEQLYTALL